MIARIWNGRTHSSKLEAYSTFLKKTAIPDYQKTPGYLGLNFLRRIAGNEAYFQLITFWKDLSAIQDFAGPDLNKAKYYPEDREFLLEQELNVLHFEVFAQE